MKRLIVIAAVALLAGCASTPLRTPHPKSGAIVMVGGGHGSGVYIGSGILLTSAHVVGDEKTVMLKSPDGYVQPATVAWVSEKYDIAAIQPVNPERFKAAPVDCRVPSVGAYAVAYGSPLHDEFLYLPGVIAGLPVKLGAFESVSRATIPVTSGNSGGAVFGDDGDVIGIVAAIAVSDLGGTPSQTGLAYFVPGNVICGLLGRG